MNDFSFSYGILWLGKIVNEKIDSIYISSRKPITKQQKLVDCLEKSAKCVEKSLPKFDLLMNVCHERNRFNVVIVRLEFVNSLAFISSVLYTLLSF